MAFMLRLAETISCPRCKASVVVTSDGKCPVCGAEIAQEKLDAYSYKNKGYNKYNFLVAAIAVPTAIFLLYFIFDSII
tara:strand:- start:1962 stop:2195 length:234 start_codon:yes stop_codon:yes gene_type:complete